MDTEKVNEFKNYLKEIIAGNAVNVLGTRAVFNNAPSKKISTITGVLKIPQDEEIIIFFDDTILGSGKSGLVITSWGIHYNADAKWDISWEEIAEKFNNFAIEGKQEEVKKIKIRNGQGNDFTIEKEIFLTMASFDPEWLKRILITGCKIFTGKEINKDQTVNTPVSNNAIPQKAEPVLQKPDEKNEPVQKTLNKDENHLEKEKAMFCSNCGNKLADESKFCPKCGTKLGEVSEEKQTPASNNNTQRRNEEIKLVLERKQGGLNTLENLSISNVDVYIDNVLQGQLNDEQEIFALPEGTHTIFCIRNDSSQQIRTNVVRFNSNTHLLYYYALFGGPSLEKV